MLGQEFRIRQGDRCICRMPLPFVIERPDEVSANWRIGTPTECKNGCDSMIAEIVAAFWPLFDMHDPGFVAKNPPDSAREESLS